MPAVSRRRCFSAPTRSAVNAPFGPGIRTCQPAALFDTLLHGPKKATRLPPRSAVVAFAVADVFSLAELIRRQRGGTAVVLGALSPRARNAQVDMFQAGEVDYLVATDAIGMGLNMDLDHVAFARIGKFDGRGRAGLPPPRSPRSPVAPGGT